MAIGFPPVIKNLLIINVLCFLAYSMFNASQIVDLGEYFALHLWGAPAFGIHQLVTHMFLHADLTHLFFNMFMLWMFGSMLERTWGSKRFLTYYLFTGLGGALLYMGFAYLEISPVLSLLDGFLDNPSIDSLSTMLSNHSMIYYLGGSGDAELIRGYQNFVLQVKTLQEAPNNVGLMSEMHGFVQSYKGYYMGLHRAVGASGAIYGILMAFGLLYPNQEIYLYFLIPVKVKYVVFVLGAAAIYMGLQNSPGDNVAHFAHLGGMLFGYLLIRYWQSQGEQLR